MKLSVVLPVVAAATLSACGSSATSTGPAQSISPPPSSAPTGPAEPSLPTGFGDVGAWTGTGSRTLPVSLDGAKRTTVAVACAGTGHFHVLIASSGKRLGEMDGGCAGVAADAWTLPNRHVGYTVTVQAAATAHWVVRVGESFD